MINISATIFEGYLEVAFVVGGALDMRTAKINDNVCHKRKRWIAEKEPNRYPPPERLPIQTEASYSKQETCQDTMK